MEKSNSQKFSDAPEVQPEGAYKPVFGKRTIKELLIDLAIWIALTSYIVVFIIKGRGREGYEALILVYMFLSLRLYARHVSISQTVYTPITFAYNSTIGRAISCIPERFRIPLMFGFTFSGLITSALVFPLGKGSTVLGRFQSLLGVIAFLAFMYGTSSNRKAIPWGTVASGLTIQFFIALFVLRTTIGFNIFNSFSKMIVTFLSFSETGMKFLIGPYEKTNFVLNVFPALIFFSSFIYVLYFWGGIQYGITKIAAVTLTIMGCSGSEAVVAAASPFVGQGESALLVKPFVEFMTRSEIHSTMTSGFATIAGSVLLAYISFGIDASLLLTSCIMSVPASLLLSKMRLPETEESLTIGKVNIPESKEKEANFLQAATNGSATGVQIVLLVAGSVLAVISLYNSFEALVGFLFSMIDVYDTVNPKVDGKAPVVSVKMILSFLFFPFAWLMGINVSEARQAGEVLALKMVVNEFVAYMSLASPTTQFSARTVQILSFALCGFANISSIGIQIGTLSAIAPTRSRDFAELAVSAMLTGTVSTWLTAAVAGVIL